MNLKAEDLCISSLAEPKDCGSSQATRTPLHGTHTHINVRSDMLPMNEVFEMMRTAFELLPTNDRLFALTLLLTSKALPNLNENSCKLVLHRAPTFPLVLSPQKWKFVHSILGTHFR